MALYWHSGNYVNLKDLPPFFRMSFNSPRKAACSVVCARLVDHYHVHGEAAAWEAGATQGDFAGGKILAVDAQVGVDRSDKPSRHQLPALEPGGQLAPADIKADIQGAGRRELDAEVDVGPLVVVGGAHHRQALQLGRHACVGVTPVHVDKLVDREDAELVVGGKEDLWFRLWLEVVDYYVRHLVGCPDALGVRQLVLVDSDRQSSTAERIHAVEDGPTAVAAVHGGRRHDRRATTALNRVAPWCCDLRHALDSVRCDAGLNGKRTCDGDTRFEDQVTDGLVRTHRFGILSDVFAHIGPRRVRWIDAVSVGCPEDAPGRIVFGHDLTDDHGIRVSILVALCLAQPAVVVVGDRRKGLDGLEGDAVGSLGVLTRFNRQVADGVSAQGIVTRVLDPDLEVAARRIKKTGVGPR